MLHVPCHFVHLNSLMYPITFPGGTRKTTYVGYGAPPIFHCNHNNILYIHLHILIYMSLDLEINFLYLVTHICNIMFARRVCIDAMVIIYNYGFNDVWIINILLILHIIDV